jgi:hypothetical protein
MEDTMRDLLSKLDALISETALKDKEDLEAKRKALQDLQMDPVASKDPEISQAIIQRKADLEKEAKSKGIEESVPVKEGSAHGYNVVKWYEKWNDQGKLTKWLKKEAGLPKDAPVYFDDADLVYDDKTIVRDALVDPKLKFIDLLNAVAQAGGGKTKQSFQGVYRDPEEISRITGEGFEIGDAFGISFSEDFEIGAEIVDILEDGVVIELDETAINYLSENGFTFEDGEIVEGKQHGNSKIYDKCWKGYRKVSGKSRGEPGSCEKIGESGLQYYTGKKKYGKDGMAALAKAGRDGASEEELGRIKDKYKKEEYEVDEAEYQGRKVPLGKPMKGDVKKSKVYVKNAKGNVVKVNFGDKKMRIKKSNPNRRKSFRARHNCANPGPRWKARYWSCRAW